jgi:hypothetical protein
MADPYPSVPQKVGTVREATAGTEVDLAVSGKPRLRSFYSKQWAMFRVIHECTEAEKDDLLEHFQLYADDSFLFTYSADEVAYTVKYGSAPQERPIEGTYLWVVESTLVEL